MTFDLTTLGALATLLALGVGVFVAWIRSTLRADLSALQQSLIGQLTSAEKATTERIQAQTLTFGSLREAILERIDLKLADFVRTQTFRDYVESHAKEHLRIETELTRFRDWKHDEADPMLRRHDAKLEDVELK
jgi:hypothetical protein